MLRFELVCTLHAGAYARAKEHARSQKRNFVSIRLQQWFSTYGSPPEVGSPNYSFGSLVFCEHLQRVKLEENNDEQKRNAASHQSTLVAFL